MNTPDTEKCCEKCTDGSISGIWCNDESCSCHTPDTEGKVRDYQSKFYGVKNSFVKCYADADTWSREYLNDHMEALQKFDSLIAELPTLIATVAQEAREERDTYWKERVRAEIKKARMTRIEWAGTTDEQKNVLLAIFDAHNQALDTLLDNLK